MFDALAFTISTIVAAWLAWSSWRERYAHGIFRFFAFESMTLLVLRNRRLWFSDPLSPRQLASWGLLLASIGLAAHGFHLLRVVGRPRGQLETTTALVRSGAYRYIRHPLYSSLLCFAWGAFLKRPSLSGLGLAGAASAALYATARVEEGELMDRFGAEYAAYMQDTRRFIPGVW